MTGPVKTLSATPPSSFISRARYTSPMPPSPILAVTEYGLEDRPCWRREDMTMKTMTIWFATVAATVSAAALQQGAPLPAEIERVDLLTFAQGALFVQ